MATTGELRAIIQDLQLIDIGDAASYLGEEEMDVEDIPTIEHPALVLIPQADHLITCNCIACQVLSA